jgi:acetoacetate decarboxylase
MKREYEELETNFVKFNELGQMVEGEILDVDTTNDDFDIYTLKDDDGIIRQFHDSTQLKDLLLQCNKGDYIQVSYIDTKQMPNGELKVFSVKRSK